MRTGHKTEADFAPERLALSNHNAFLPQTPTTEEGKESF